MKILFFTYDLPFPLDSGGKIRSFNLIRELSKKHKIHLFSFYRNKNQLNNLAELEKYCQSIKTFKRRKVNSLKNIFYLPFFPFPAALYFDQRVKTELVEKVKANKFDIIHFESFYTTAYLSKKIKTPQIVGTENVEWQVYKNYVDIQKNLLVRIFLQIEINRIKNFEEKSWRSSTANLAVSNENAKYIKQVSGKKCYLIPNGIDIKNFNIVKKEEKRIKNVLFIGNLKYIQNQDAVDWLINDIWPRIKFKEQTKLLIVGQETSRLKSKIKGKNIEILENIKDIKKIYSMADVVVAPIRIGSGTQFKILEAMAAGIPIVTTSLGAEGIKHDNKKWAIIADSSEEFISSIETLLPDQKITKNIADNAKEIIKKYYDWSKITKDLEKAYEEIVNNYR